VSRAILLGVSLLSIAACFAESSMPDDFSAPPAPQPIPVEALAGEIRRVATLSGTGEEPGSAPSVRVAPGLELSLWASEEIVEDPVALVVDEYGQVFVTYSSRKGSPLDIRRHADWRIPALAMQTTDDFRDHVRAVLAPELSEENDWVEDLNEDGLRDWRDLTVETERLARVLDTDGDGTADLAQIMYEGFNSEISDVAGAILVRDGDVYVGAAPEMLRLRDIDGDGLIDESRVVSGGYGIHPSYAGHGMSGAVNGPDGRIYWSIGDMGVNTVDREGNRWAYPYQGAILRAEPDGSGFEVFAAGLRNAHEFAFDEYGNMISVDNDGDHQGETERLVYIVEGSDSGWRVNWQFGKYSDPDNNGYHVWMTERLFEPHFEGQAAYILPPVAAYHSGPAGLVYNPGTALDERWANHFFVSAFTGTGSSSRIHAFQLRPSGAGFELARDTVVLQGLTTTGMDFGPDGALYFGDWISGYDSKGAGRIWKLDSPTGAGSPLRVETQQILASDFGRWTGAELLGLLRHADMRVRLKAQYELAARGDAETLLAATQQREHQLARIHGIWGIGQLARRNASYAAPIVDLLGDDDAEIRAQSAKLLGDIRYAPAADRIVPLLADDSERVRFFAAEALGRIGHAPAVQHLITMLEANDDRDVYLRHAGSLALARIGNADALTELAEHPSRAVRIAAVVALRRMKHPGVAAFLADADEYVVTEAARAINDDGGIPAAFPALGALLETTRSTEPALIRRAINANHREGAEASARRVAAYALRTDAAAELRVEALAALGVWPDPSLVDRVDGYYHGPVQRDTSIARAALGPLIDPLLADADEDVRVAVANAAGRLRLGEAAQPLLAALQNDAAPRVRVAALDALHAIGGHDEAAMRIALADSSPNVRMNALSLVPSLGLPATTTAELLASVLGRTTATEQQAALAALGQLGGPDAELVLAAQLDAIINGELAPELHLDVIEAIEAAQTPALEDALARYQAAKPQGDAVEAFRETLYGGSVQRGRQIVLQNTDARCMQCHTVGTGAGSDVGPDLAGVGSRLDRRAILQSLVDPSAVLAPGYGAGGPSAMPAMQQFLTPSQIRDVVAYLSSLTAQ